MSKNITFLPKKIAENTIKIELPTSDRDTARAILVILKEGFVKEHSHLKEDNKDSEVYIDLLEMLRINNNIDKISIPQVAGSNSPTGLTSHFILPKNEMQIFIAIKRSQKDDEWIGLKNNLKKFIENLNIEITKSGDGKVKIDIDGVIVIIDLISLQIIYNNRNKDIQKFETLEELKQEIL